MKIKHTVITILFLFISMSLFAQQFDEYVVFPSIKIEISNDTLKYSEWGKGFSYEYVSRGYRDFSILDTIENEYVVFKSDIWLYLVPTCGGDILYGTKRYRDRSAPPEPSYVLFDSITSTSFLTEKISGESISYTADRLLNWDIRDGWVEGNPGDGTGEELTLVLRPNEKTSSLIFYNGYFSPRNLDLYYKNCRIRSLEVTLDDGSSFVIELEDSPSEQIVVLPEESHSFKLEVKSVYPGTLYQDLAISGIFANINYYSFR